MPRPGGAAIGERAAALPLTPAALAHALRELAQSGNPMLDTRRPRGRAAQAQAVAVAIGDCKHRSGRDANALLQRLVEELDRIATLRELHPQHEAPAGAGYPRAGGKVGRDCTLGER